MSAEVAVGRRPWVRGTPDPEASCKPMVGRGLGFDQGKGGGAGISQIRLRHRSSRQFFSFNLLSLFSIPSSPKFGETSRLPTTRSST